MFQPPSHQPLPWPPSYDRDLQTENLHLLRDAQSQITALLTQHRLPDDYRQVLEAYVLPLSAWLRVACGDEPQGLLVGVTGAQGSGKTTMSAALQQILSLFGLRCCVLSIDDFYLTKSERVVLAQTIHPLFVTRGVPGTHDIARLKAVINELFNAAEHTQTSYPQFDKANDDRFPASKNRVFCGKPDVILLEGWCVGAKPQTEAELVHPVNPLEENEDPGGHWRRYVNDKLATDYATLFDQIDLQVFLSVAGMETVFEHRALQEQKLRAADSANYHSELNHPLALQRFIMHYERITRVLLRDMPSSSDICFRIGAHHEIESASLQTQRFGAFVT